MTAPAPFSPADLALVELIAEGLDNTTIGVKLGMTRDQTSHASGYLLTSHHVHHRAGLVALACRSGQLGDGGHPGTPLPWRQAALLPGIADGLTDQQIAGRLCLSKDAVKARVRLLLKQLGATNRANAVLLAHRAGLLPEATR